MIFVVRFVICLAIRFLYLILKPSNLFLLWFFLTTWLFLCLIFDREKLNSMNLLLYMSPIAILVLLPAALIMEPNVVDVTVSLGREHKYMWLLLLVNSVMAYSANLSNFLVTKHTSALTLQVLTSFPSFFNINIFIHVALFSQTSSFRGWKQYMYVCNSLLSCSN